MYVTAPKWKGSASLNALGNRYIYHGLGQLNCPGDPGCPGNLSNASDEFASWFSSLSPSDQTSMNYLLQGAYGTTTVVPSSSGSSSSPSSSATPTTFSAWLQQNAVTVALALAAGTILIMAVK